MDTADYLDVFIDESREHLDVLYQQLLELENHPTDMSIIEEIFRAAHTLKGMAATMGYESLANLTHKLENIFDGIRDEKIQVSTETMDVLFESVDDLNRMVEDISGGGNGSKEISKIVESLDEIEEGKNRAESNVDLTKNAPTIAKSENTLRSIKELDEFELSILKESENREFINYEITVHLNKDCLLKGARTLMVFNVLERMGEVIKAEPPVHELEEENFDSIFTVIFVSKLDENEMREMILTVSEIDKVTIQPFSIQNYEKEEGSNNSLLPRNDNNKEKEIVKRTNRAASKTIRVRIDRLNTLMNLFEELVIDRGRLEQISQEFEHQDLRETVERMSRISGDLQNVILTMRMVPIDQVFSRFPNMIRSLSRELHKKININIVGADTELDRTVIDEIGDPLIHLLRNAVDHGVETPDIRQTRGKPEEGTIRLEAYHSGNHVIIEIADDGGGINKEAVLNKALQNELITEQEVRSLSDQEVNELILASGFSTAETVSDISGRGVGLDVVKNTIESLGGSIAIESEFGKGTIFTVQLPLTLSIISAMLVDVEKEKYAIPLSSIIETAIMKKSDVFSARNKQVIDFRGKIVPLVFLKDLFSIPLDNDKAEVEYLSIVVVKKGERLAGLVVDSFIGQQEIVLKSLGDYLTNVFAISGATILGDGQVALIVDSDVLIK
ncbi:chemotaxis protein CheA [Virgibacillus sp. MSJ-26]|uniref:chemotaxis protein CheA n=1 Tax=Virgibacillus sp. MSJ-26 TaxID=2841522 RepID=UPI001C11D549|nr:chemotaxis protein CheA [Virgibacillus sp. MSJ-26]MBU5466757.1 chemotaxis protein CheA [Virgibacillus sp. MSJ-26]